MSEEMKMDADRAAFDRAWKEYKFTDVRQCAEYFWQARASLPVGVPDAYKCTPKNGGNPFVIRRSPDSWELRECDIEVIPVHLGDEETDQSIASDCYWHIADVMGTQRCWSVQEHVEFMREIVQDASEFLHDIPEGSVGGDDKAVELCRRIRLCLAGVEPGYTPPLFAPAAPSAPAGEAVPVAGVEAPEVVGWRDPAYNWATISADNKASCLAGESWQAASVKKFTEPLMTVAQHNRIVAQLVGGDSVSVPRELAERLADPEAWLQDLRKSQSELRALLASRGRGEA